MSNIIGSLINLLSTKNDAVVPMGSRGKSLSDGMTFEQALLQAEGQGQDPSLLQTVTGGENPNGEAVPATDTTAPVVQETSLATFASETQVVQQTFHLSIHASSLEAGMQQVTQLLQSLSSLSDTQGAALVSSLTGGAVPPTDAVGFVQTLKSILKGLTAQDAIALQGGALQSQWLDRLQQDPQATASLAQAMGSVSQAMALLPNSSSNPIPSTGSSDHSPSTTTGSNNPWAGFQITGFSYAQTETDLFSAGAVLTTTQTLGNPMPSNVSQVQLPSDWKVTTAGSPLTDQAGSSSNLKALVDLLTQSNAGKVLLTQAVAYEFELKVSSQSGAWNEAFTTVVPQNNAPNSNVSQPILVTDVQPVLVAPLPSTVTSTLQTVFKAIQELQSKETGTPLLPAGTTAILDEKAKPVVVSQNVLPVETTQGQNTVNQTVVLRLDASAPTAPSSIPAGTPVTPNPVMVSTTVSDDSNALKTLIPVRQQTVQPALLTTSPVMLPQAGANVPMTPQLDASLSVSADKTTVVSRPIVGVTEPSPKAASASVNSVPLTEDTQAVLSKSVLAPIPTQTTIVLEPVTSNPVTNDANNTQKNTIAVEVPQLAAISNQIAAPILLATEKPVTKTDTPSLSKTTQSVSVVPVATPVAVPPTPKTVETTVAQNNQPFVASPGAANPDTTSGVVKTQNSLPTDSQSGQTVGSTPSLKVKTDTQNTTWTVVSTVNQDVSAASDASKPSQAQTSNIIQQIANQVSVEVVQAHTVSHLSFQLVPENLGKITIQVSLVDQLVTAKILVTHNDVREALQKNMVELKTSLYQAGLQVDQLQVQVQGGGSGLLSQYYQFQQNGNARTTSSVQDDQVKRENAALGDEIASVQGSWNVVNLLV